MIEDKILYKHIILYKVPCVIKLVATVAGNGLGMDVEDILNRHWLVFQNQIYASVKNDRTNR